MLDFCNFGQTFGPSWNAWKAYFLGVKQLPEEEFDKLWKVVSQIEYDFVLSAANRDGKQYEWWREEESYLDADAPITESKDDN